jgi:hypothetical protein
VPDGSFADRFTFSLPVTTEVQIDMTSSLDAHFIDTYLALFDGSGAIIATDDDGGDLRNSRIRMVLPAGSYTVWANSFFPRKTGRYTLILSSACQLTVPVSPPTIGQFVPIFGELLFEGDCRGGRFGSDWFVDRYLLNVMVPTEVQILMESTDFDTYLSLMSTNAAVIAENDDGGGGTNSQLQTVVQPGQYLIEASSFPGIFSAKTGEYGLAVRGPCHFSSAHPLPATGAPASSLSGTLANSDCRFVDRSFADAYTFTVPFGGATVDILLTGSFDTYLLLSTPNGKTLQGDDDSGGGLNSRIVRTLEEGTYIIWANSFFQETTGTYTLSLTRTG